jgi:hypothetical protein
MLSAREFTVGALEQAHLGCLILPRSVHEEILLVGEFNGNAAVLLSGEHRFACFACSDNNLWHGLIVPNVGVEVDEASGFDPRSVGSKIGSIVRSDTRLLLTAKLPQSIGSIRVVLESGLPSAASEAAFSKWQVVLGKNESRRILATVDIFKPAFT